MTNDFVPDDEGGVVGVRGGAGDIFGINPSLQVEKIALSRNHEIENCQNLNVDISQCSL